MIDSRSSNIFWTLKAIAIVSVFYAHLEWQGDSVGFDIYRSIGCVGVPLFMLMAGFFDARSKASLTEKIKRLFLPLLIWGTLTFLINIYKLQIPIETCLKEYLKWLYGCGTWYYFIPVLFWCQLLVRYVNKWGLAICGLISMLLTHLDVIPINEYLTPYSNPFNLILYFLIGREYRLKKGDIIPLSSKTVVIAVFVLWLFIIIFKTPLYWNVLTPVFSVSLFYFLWFVLNYLPESKSIVKVGKISFVLYLCHMQIAQSIAGHFCNMSGGAVWGNLLKVPIAFICVVIMVLALERILKYKECNKMLLWLGYK